jgi:HEAT repeat protein
MDMQEYFGRISSLTIKELIQITRDSDVPAYARMAAVRLYDLGKKEFAFEFLLSMMNQYKDPKKSPNTIRETCQAAAEELGRLKDKKAIDPLFEALGVLAYGAAYGLAKIGGKSVENRLLDLSSDNTKEGIYAAIALGYMKINEVVPLLASIIDNKVALERKFKDENIGLLKINILPILGSYINNDDANDYFKKYFKPYIGSIISWYIVQEENNFHEVEWETVSNYSWFKYIDSARKREAFKHTSNLIENEDIRNEIVNAIYQDMKNR